MLLFLALLLSFSLNWLGKAIRAQRVLPCLKHLCRLYLLIHALIYLQEATLLIRVVICWGMVLLYLAERASVG